MKFIALLAAAGISLSACATTDGNPARDPWTAEQPSDQLIDTIEGALSKDTCIGELSRWARFYEWRQTADGIDTKVVEINLRQAGVYGYKSGRNIRSRDPSLKPGEIMVRADDRHYRVAFASYRVSTGELDIHNCAQNRK